MKKKQFNIKLQEPWSSEDYLPPDDPLGELTDLELGLRRFFYECNHRVTIEMGYESKDVFLFPDISLLIERLPEKIADLSHNESVELEFPESWFTIGLLPVDGRVMGTLSQYGRRVRSKHVDCSLAQVLRVLRRFTEQIVQRAVDRGYISQDEADEFLSRRQEVDGYHSHSTLLQGAFFMEPLIS